MLIPSSHLYLCNNFVLLIGSVHHLTMIHQREQKSLAKKSHIGRQTNKITIRSRDPILTTIERTAVMLIMTPKSKLSSFTAAKRDWCKLVML
jgi:hypothetical protein